MHTKTNGTHGETDPWRNKMPVDVRILAYILYAIGFFQLACSTLLVTGIAHLGDKTHRAFFGILPRPTELSHALYMLCLAFVHFLCAWELMTGRKLGWWLLLFNTTYYTLVSVYGFQEYKLTAWIGLGINVAIFTWLYLRRQLYKVGLRQAPTAHNIW